MTFVHERLEPGQGPGVRAEFLSKFLFEFVAQAGDFCGRDLRAEEVPEGRVVPLPQDVLREVLGSEWDPVGVEKVNPLAKVKRVAVNEHAVHVEDDGFRERRV